MLKPTVAGRVVAFRPKPSGNAPRAPVKTGFIYSWGDAPLPLKDGRRLINGPDERTAALFPTFAHFAGYDDGFARVAPVGSFPPNPFGLYDMAGNAYEWMQDWIMVGNAYSGGRAVDPAGSKSGTEKVVRGAGWGYPPEQFRLSFRGMAGLDFWTATFGFRCARDTKPTGD